MNEAEWDMKNSADHGGRQEYHYSNENRVNVILKKLYLTVYLFRSSFILITSLNTKQPTCI